ncbi:glutathione S-transferase family protein [Leptothoe sp. ISB3NOV94-8A]
MIKLYHNPMTRSLRVLWLLEELGLSYVLEPVELKLPEDGKIFAQDTPTGRFPTLEDGAITMGESGAIIEYLLECYGGGHLAPTKGAPLRANFLQWMHFPEGTLNPYINAIRRFEKTAPTVVAAMKEELDIAIACVDHELVNQSYIVGDSFTGADIMVSVSLLAINMLGLLSDQHSNIAAYLERLKPRPALIRAMQR